MTMWHALLTSRSQPVTRELWVWPASTCGISCLHIRVSFAILTWSFPNSEVLGAEIKIVYAVNPTVATQLYEVDVFMFFLQDLEAVSNNFYHDLWQAVRLHTPKVFAFSLKPLQAS